MNPEQAKGLLEMFLQTYARESATTRKVIAAVPNDKKDYKPHEKYMTAFEQAWHLPSSEWWFLTSVADGKFGGGEPGIPANIKTVEDVLKFYDTETNAALERVKALPAEKLAQNVDFMGMMSMPAVLYINLMNNHSIHHRGALSMYLRPMGAKVPSIYGPSADEGIAASA
jgi:uncharacterized damage-inducible protein DinB